MVEEEKEKYRKKSKRNKCKENMNKRKKRDGVKERKKEKKRNRKFWNVSRQKNLGPMFAHCRDCCFGV